MNTQTFLLLVSSLLVSMASALLNTKIRSDKFAKVMTLFYALLCLTLAVLMVCAYTFKLF